jgi:nicotinamidase-related amidase
MQLTSNLVDVKIMRGGDCGSLPGRRQKFVSAVAQTVAQCGQGTSSQAARDPAMDAMIVVDMQVGLLSGPPKHDLQSVVDRINRLAAMVRARSGKVIWIRHCGRGDEFASGRPGWAFLPELDRRPTDFTVEKSLNDPFAGTDLQMTLTELKPERVLIAGWATDFCVDATVRSSVTNNHHVVVVSDAHTLNDRPHLAAPAVIHHHNWVWSELITNRSIRIVSTAELLAEG